MSPPRFRIALGLVAVLTGSVCGLAQPTSPIQPAPVPPAESPELLDRVEGNWEVTTTDSRYPGKTEVTKISLWKKWRLMRNGTPMDPGGSFPAGTIVNNWVWQRVDDSDWYGLDRGALTYSANGSFALKGYGNRVSTFRPVSGEVMRGRWKDGEFGGEETWRRLVPRITSVEFIGMTTDRVTVGERTGRLHVRYEPGDGYRGNKAGFTIKMKGENLGGNHVCWVEGGDVEAYSISLIRTNPAGEDYMEMQDFGGRDPITGRFMYGHTWSKATPGMKRLHFDNITIPFQLDLEDFPKPTTALRFVRQAGGRFEIVPELNHGDEFYVEAVYATAPAQPPAKVSVSWTDGDPREVALTATADPKIFRSGALRVEPPVKSTP